jgi:hypothetical protein
MRVLTSVAGVALAASLAACSGISTNFDFDPQANFTGYQTWAWMEMQPDPQFTDLQRSRLRSSVESGMAAKGLELVRSQPDVFVGYQVILDEQVSYNTVNNYYGGGWGYRGWYGPSYGMTMGSSQTTETRVQVGTLILDIFDAGTKELVWRGTGESKIQEIQDPQERQARLDKAVAKILENFPPPRG